MKASQAAKLVDTYELQSLATADSSVFVIAGSLSFPVWCVVMNGSTRLRLEILDY